MITAGRYRTAGLAVAWLLACAASLPAENAHRETTFEGAPALLLSNDKMALTLLATGGNFVDLQLAGEAAQLSPFWNPAQIARTAGRPGRRAGGGHFVCVDGFGTPSDEERRAGMPGHGEAHTQKWTIISSEKRDGVASIQFEAGLPLVQETFRRRVQMVDNENVVYVDSELENLMAFDRPINWAEHATVGAPFLAPGQTVVDMSAKRSRTRAHNDEEDPYPHRLADFKDFTWPMAPGQSGDMIDLRNAPLNPNSLDHTTSLMEVDRKLVFVTALNLQHRLLLGYVFRREEYPWLQIWESYPPNMGGARGLEFGTQPFDIPRRQVIERGPMFDTPVVRWLPAKSKLTSRFLFFYTRVPDNFSKVDDVQLVNGKLTVEDHVSRQTVVLAASLGL